MKKRYRSIVATVMLAGTMACFAGNGNDITLKGECGSVALSLEGGRLLSWKDRTGNEIFFMPDKESSPNGDWSHGGTSLCWPWFGRKGTAESSIHGFARNRRFTMRGRNKTAGGEQVVIGLKLSAAAEALFPYDADLTMTIRLSSRLELTLRTSNEGKKPFAVTDGFQSYFSVSDYANVRFDGVTADDFTAVNGMDKAFPRIGDSLSFSDTGTGREIHLSAKGNTGIVVWTPGTVEPANRNLAKDDCPRFIVIGPSNRAAEGAITVGPGESHELALSLECSCTR